MPALTPGPRCPRKLRLGVAHTLLDEGPLSHLQGSAAAQSWVMAEGVKLTGVPSTTAWASAQAMGDEERQCGRTGVDWSRLQIAFSPGYLPLVPCSPRARDSAPHTGGKYHATWESCIARPRGFRPWRGVCHVV